MSKTLDPTYQTVRTENDERLAGNSHACESITWGNRRLPSVLCFLDLGSVSSSFAQKLDCTLASPSTPHRAGRVTRDNLFVFLWAQTDDDRSRDRSSLFGEVTLDDSAY